MRNSTVLAQASFLALLAAALWAPASRPASAQAIPADRAAAPDFAGAGRLQTEGETEFKVWSTLFGTVLAFAAAKAMDADGQSALGIGLALGAPAGFFGGRAFARSRPLSLGQAGTIAWGGSWGAVQGMALARAVDLGSGERITQGDIVDEPESTKALAASVIAGGVVGIAGGMLAARREITPGTAASAQMGSMWGWWLGLATARLMDLEDNRKMATMMVAGNAGLVGGALAGSRWAPSESRIRRMGIGSVIGAAGGAVLGRIADRGRRKSAIAAGLAGGIAGLGLGAILGNGDKVEEDISGRTQASKAVPAAGSLLNWSGGDWSLSAPVPSPVLDSALRMSGRYGVTGRDGLVWKVPLLNVRF